MHGSRHRAELEKESFQLSRPASRMYFLQQSQALKLPQQCHQLGKTSPRIWALGTFTHHHPHSSQCRLESPILAVKVETLCTPLTFCEVNIILKEFFLFIPVDFKVTFYILIKSILILHEKWQFLRTKLQTCLFLPTSQMNCLHITQTQKVSWYGTFYLSMKHSKEFSLWEVTLIPELYIFFPHILFWIRKWYCNPFHYKENITKYLQENIKNNSNTKVKMK